MRTSDFDYPLPPELIAQEPAAQRDASRLLVLARPGGSVTHRRFRELPDYLRTGDLLVLNDTRVIPARLRGVNARTGGEFEILLLEAMGPDDWWAMVRPGKRARIGTQILLRRRAEAQPAARSASGKDTGCGLSARVVEVNEEGHRRLRFEGQREVTETLDEFGETPLPPYIERAVPNRRSDDRERYQTVYAQTSGSVAAPTAGLHFTQTLLSQIRELGVELCFVTLHVGLGTFGPVKAERLNDHVMHEERFQVSAAAAAAINRAQASARRTIAVGTTTLRVLESVAAEHNGRMVAGNGRTRLFIHPPYRFRLVDALLTNFHLPRSSLLMLISAFAAPGELTRGRDLVLAAYREAVRERYRFFSYGDAMLIL